MLAYLGDGRIAVERLCEEQRAAGAVAQVANYNAPTQLVLVGTVMEAAVFLFQVPTGIVADLYGRKLSVVIACAEPRLFAAVTSGKPFRALASSPRAGSKRRRNCAPPAVRVRKRSTVLARCALVFRNAPGDDVAAPEDRRSCPFPCSRPSSRRARR